MLSNHGDDALTIDSVKIAGQNNDSSAFELINAGLLQSRILEPDSSLTVQVRFSPLKTGTVIDSVLISSSDPLRENTTVRLSGTGTAPKIELSSTQLDFGQLPLDSDSLKILYIYNRGDADLLIIHDSLSISGGHAASFSIENVTEDINLGPDDSATIRIIFQPVQTGVHEAELHIVSNDPHERVSPISLSGRAYNPSPVTISFNQLLSSNPFTNNQPATIAFKINGSQSVDSAFVFLRPGGMANFTRLPLNLQSGEDWTTGIDASLVTERGVEFYVHVWHAPTSTYYPANGNNTPKAIQVDVPQMTFPWQTKKEVYQMISIPLATSGQDLKTLFEDELGPYDNTKYRIYDLPDGAQYTEVTGLDETLPPGKALWLITKEPVNLGFSSAHSVVTDHDFELSLQKGWNLIASPFAFPIGWSQVSTQLALRYYDGSDWPFASLLEPFKGYAVNVANDTVLLIPTREAAAVSKVKTTDYREGSEGWRIRIAAESASSRDLFNYIGALRQSTSAIDRYDYPEPPPIGQFISLALVSENSSDKFSTDYREPDIDEYVFAFELSTNLNEPINISFHEEDLPEQYDWLVVSEKQGIYFPEKFITGADKQVHYKILVGTDQYIEAAKSNFSQIPLAFHLEQNFPNPFNPNTTIKFNLPQTSIVTINLYNILGQRINSLMKGVKKEAGVYQIEWNGQNEFGEPVASGMYFLHLNAGTYNHFIKMILSR